MRTILDMIPDAVERYASEFTASMNSRHRQYDDEDMAMALAIKVEDYFYNVVGIYNRNIERAIDEYVESYLHKEATR